MLGSCTQTFGTRMDVVGLTNSNNILGVDRENINSIKQKMIKLKVQVQMMGRSDTGCEIKNRDEFISVHDHKLISILQPDNG